MRNTSNKFPEIAPQASRWLIRAVSQQSMSKIWWSQSLEGLHHDQYCRRFKQPDSSRFLRSERAAWYNRTNKDEKLSTYFSVRHIRKDSQICLIAAPIAGEMHCVETAPFRQKINYEKLLGISPDVLPKMILKACFSVKDARN
ncbi:hypothetical protein [Roseobacter litoralis]|uniref:hypothetical protein n=1 Tax=Roseobacter litoralis TaxID=42443 RepID=UPI0024958B23|nr:hypothetical protein [Roseobacter litoralis]